MGDEDHGDTRALPQAPHVVIEASWRVISVIKPRRAAKGSSIKSSFGPVTQFARAMENAHLHAARQFARIGVGEIGKSPTMSSVSMIRSREACYGFALCSRSGR